MEVVRMGVIKLFVDIKVSVDEMKDWEERRIARFFEGLRLVQFAANPNNYDRPGICDTEKGFCGCGGFHDGTEQPPVIVGTRRIAIG